MHKLRLIFSLIILLAGQLTFSQNPVTAKKEGSEDEGGKPPGVLPKLLRGPYLQCATSSAMLIRWRTDASARSRVRFGTAPGTLDRTSDDSMLVTDHRVMLKG